MRTFVRLLAASVLSLTLIGVPGTTEAAASINASCEVVEYGTYQYRVGASGSGGDRLDVWLMYYDERAGTTYAVAHRFLEDPNEGSNFVISDVFNGQGPASYYWVEAAFINSDGTSRGSDAC